MKKKLGFIISGVVATGILGFGVLYSSTSQAEASLSTNDIKDMVNEQYPGKITEIAQETEFNRAVYEVEIKTEDREYDIKLDGKTGEILNITENPIKEKVNNEKDQSKEEKAEENTSKEQPEKVVINEKNNEESNKQEGQTQKSNNKQNKNEKSQQKKDKTKKAIISYDEATRIALDAFSGKIDDIELDREDGRLIYEVEIERGDKEAEIEIDAYTGEIIMIEIDED